MISSPTPPPYTLLCFNLRVNTPYCLLPQSTNTRKVADLADAYFGTGTMPLFVFPKDLADLLQGVFLIEVLGVRAAVVCLEKPGFISLPLSYLKTIVVSEQETIWSIGEN